MSIFLNIFGIFEGVFFFYSIDVISNYDRFVVVMEFVFGFGVIGSKESFESIG